ncbi:unnamed protein product [Tuber melanosporum]|uniref:(Perigord truffle) hypothetical protein n=1 Tax=Tuber melanosporum (strain Mel28) TaxID=656061 RepID=D5GM75_TUBMM|nr:uncharacterized protein GSTUM_00010556001 [Tuber melanosporum]CAZ85618.1 unnamed protein product [Tuber melanosporum]
MFPFYTCRLPELQMMRSSPGDYSLQAAIPHRFTITLRLRARLFSVIRRDKQCIRTSPKAIESSVSVLCPSTTPTKASWAQTVVPVEPGAVSSACAAPTGKEKSQQLFVPVRITISGRLSYLSTFLKSVGKGAPSRLESDGLPFRKGKLVSGASNINGSSVCPAGFTGEKGCSNHTFSRGLSDLPYCTCRPPNYTTTTVIPGSKGPERDQGTLSRDSASTEERHNMSLGTNTTEGTDTYDAAPENYVEVAPSPTLTLASSSVPTLRPTHEVEVRKVSRKSVMESDFLHFYSTLKPYIVQRELPSRSVERVPRPVDDGPLPEHDGLRVLEKGPFTTPAGGTSAPEVQEPPSEPPPLPKSVGVFHEKDTEIKRADPCLASVLAAPTGSISRQLISQPIAPRGLPDEVLGKIMTWDLDVLHARTGISQTLSSSLHSAQNKWQILAFDWAFKTGDASMFRDSYSFAYNKPLALRLPCPSPRITELEVESGPVLRKAASEIQPCDGGGSGSSSSTQARQGSGSRAHLQQSKSTQPSHGRKRANDGDGDDRKGKGRGRREGPPVGGDPPPPGSEDGGVHCPYWVRYRLNCKKKSCINRKKNLSKLKEHLRRAHFLHLRCPFENCKFHAGDKFQVKRHQKTAHVGQAELEPILRTTDSKLRRKNEALGTRNLNWDQIYEICFREEPDDPVTELMVSPDGADFESEGEEEEEEFEDEEDDEDLGAQGGYGGREAPEENAEYRGRHTGDPGSAVAVEENHRENPIPPTPFKASQSMLSNGAPTIPDTPELAPMSDEGHSLDPSKTRWSGLFGENEGLPSPAPDRDNFPSFQQPLFSSAGNMIPWEAVEEHTHGKFEDFRRTLLEDLKARHGTSPKTAQQFNHVLLDVERIFGGMHHIAKLAPRLPDGGSGPVASHTRDSYSYVAQPAGQSEVPLNYYASRELFQGPANFPVRDDNLALPSLTTADTLSLHDSARPGAAPQDLVLDGVPALGPRPAMASDPVGSGMPQPQAGPSTRRVRDNFGNVLAHWNNEGLWSVGGDPSDMQSSFDFANANWWMESGQDGEGEGGGF